MAFTVKHAERYANESGFPLQIAIQHTVDESVFTTGWSVRYVEHGWLHPDTGSSGFIDLALQSSNAQILFIVECKRVQNSAWVFMHYSGNASPRLHCRAWITHARDEEIIYHGWGNTTAEPACPEVTFCTVRGENSIDKGSVLENIGSNLVLATEALAITERDFRERRESRRLHFQLIVTTAPLFVVDMDPASITLADGTTSNSIGRTVPYLRLRKQLALHRHTLKLSDVTMLGDPSYSMENTVFVVQAEHLLEFLTQFRATAQ
jgi:hypothetical protein